MANINFITCTIFVFLLLRTIELIIHYQNTALLLYVKGYYCFVNQIGNA